MATAEFFAQYDNFRQQETALVGTEEKLQLAEENLAKNKVELSSVDRELQKLTKKMGERRASIDSCQKNFIKGSTLLQPQLWFKGGVAGKVVRQEEKLATEEAQLPTLQTKESQLKRHVTQHEKEVEQLSSVEAQKEGIHGQVERMFEEACAGAPTPAYHQLMATRTQALQMVEAENEVVTAMDATIKMFEKADVEYGKALSDMNRAAQENQEAQYNVSGMKMMEVFDEKDRDRYMNYAQAHANAGASELAQAMTMIPVAARNRHPQLCPSGNVQMNSVSPGGLMTGAASMMQNFGGHQQSFLGGMLMGGGMQQQTQQIAQSRAEAGKQLGQARALLSACKQDAAAASANLAQVDAQLRSEKQQIFNSLRQAAGVDPIPYGGVVPPLGMPMPGAPLGPTPPPSALIGAYSVNR